MALSRPLPQGPWERGPMNFDAPSGTYASDQVWLELVQRFLRSRKCELWFLAPLQGPWGGGPMNLTILMALQVLMLDIKFGWNWSSGSWEEVESLRTTDDDGRSTIAIGHLKFFRCPNKQPLLEF